MPREEKVEYRLLVRDMPPAERPRERLRHSGPAALSNSELVAILLATGTSGESVLSLAQRVLARFGGLKGIATASYGELQRERGLGDAKCCQLLAALELGKRLATLNPEARPVVRSPQDLADLLMPEMSLLEQEHLRVVLLDARNQVLGIKEVYVGNVSSTVIRVSEVLRPAVRENCPAIIVVHNHPSGDPTPSQDDVQVTEEIARAGQLLDIELLDHLVIGQQRYVSLKGKGLGLK